MDPSNTNFGFWRGPPCRIPPSIPALVIPSLNDTPPTWTKAFRHVRKQYLLSVQKAYKAKCCLVVLKLPKRPNWAKSRHSSTKGSITSTIEPYFSGEIWGNVAAPQGGGSQPGQRVLPLQNAAAMPIVAGRPLQMATLFLN